MPNGKWWRGLTNVRHSMTKEWKNRRMKDCGGFSDRYTRVWWKLVEESGTMDWSFVYCAMGFILQVMSEDMTYSQEGDEPYSIRRPRSGYWLNRMLPE